MPPKAKENPFGDSDNQVKRQMVGVALREGEYKMLRRLAKDLGMPNATILRMGLHGLYYAHYGRRS